jgi:anaerobic ribonucleoside-triphosphate reductase activating protein
VSPELRTALAEDRTEVSALAREILESARALGSSRVTVSGGEPFYQPEALEKLLRLLREGGIKDILVYTGRKFHCLSKAYPWLFELVSALVDGPFEESRPTDAIWKGSAGQKFYLVDSALKEDYQPWLYGSERRVQVVPCAEGLRVLGIPKIGDYGGLFH